MASFPIFQFHARLPDSTPALWRQFQVGSTTTLSRLGCIVLCLFELQGMAPFFLDLPMQKNIAARGLPREVWSEFELSARYRIPGPDGFGEDEDSLDLSSADLPLRECLRKPGETVIFTYTPPWTVVLTVEQIFHDPDIPGRSLPRVLAGEGFGILEDCGGPADLARLVEPFRRKEGAEFAAYSRRLGLPDLDLTVFNLDDMNLRVKRIPRVYEEFYRYGIPPTRHAQDVLDRKYLRHRRRRT